MNSPPSPAERAASSRHSEGAPRRNFLVEIGAIVLGGLVGLVPFLSGVVVALDPVRRKKKNGAAYIRIASLSAVPDDGVPRSFPVVADRTDAWNFYPNEKLGAIYLVRDKGANTVTAFHSTCPHAGCFVMYLAPDKCFKCPCHNSAFASDGERLHDPGKENPAPRDLDTLEVDPEKLATAKEVWVKFENFRTGIHEKIVVA